ncbi:hypothetical protein [Halocatena marina]|uniref:hypothetical protein n=1 Tax=Halocatena marina TaxID=2934937 RepID=UPI00200BE1DC|nr:hypothetical protein [Halocatena marina]
MDLLDEIRSYFRDDEPTLTEQAAELDRQRRGDQFGDLPDEIEEMPPEDIADTFARMEQQTRFLFVRNGNISEEKWREMRSVIENDLKQQNFWGLDVPQTDFKQGTEVCRCHEEGLQAQTETLESQETIGQTQGSSKTSQTEVGSKVGGGGGVSVPGVGTIDTTGEVSTKAGRTRGETQQETVQATGTVSRTQTFYSCRVEPTDATVSRRAFLRMGDFHIRKTYNKTDSNNALVDDWEMDVEQNPELEKPQAGIDTLREERDDLDGRIEEFDNEIEAVNNRLEENDELLEQNKENISIGEGSIEEREYFLDERDRLLEKRTNIREKKNDLRAEKSELQDRIEGHEEYEEAAETAESTASVSEESEDEAVGEESAEDETQENDGTESAEESEDTALAGESEGTVVVNGTNKEASTAEATEAGKKETESTTTMDNETDSAKEEAEDGTVGDKTAKKAAEPTADPAQATGASSERGSSAPYSDGVPPEIAEAGKEGDRIMEEIESQPIENGHGESTQNIEEKPEDSGSSV